MKKSGILLALVFASLVSVGQIIVAPVSGPTPVWGQFGSTTTNTHALGLFYPHVGFINSRYADTLTANSNPYVKNYPGSQIIVNDTVYVRSYPNANKWVKLGVGSGPSGTVTSVGLSMPSAFSVANSPVTGAGTLTVTGAGTTAQYIRGDGSLATTPVLTNEWHLTGNAGTTPSTHFIGTTDNQNLRFKVNNRNSGFIEIAGSASTFFGYTAGEFASANWNTGFGWGVLSNASPGGSNTGFGTAALMDNTGGENVGIGLSAYRNGSGIRNVAVGTSAMIWSEDANENTAVGNYAMLANRQGDNNNAFGSSALRGNADGGSNVAIGNITLTQNTTSITSFNIPTTGSGYADGTYSLNISAPVVAADPNNNSLQATGTATASGGIIVSTSVTEPGKGYSSFSPPVVTLSLGGGSGATFTANLSSGQFNTAVGVSSNPLNRIGNYNTSIGYETLISNSTGTANSVVGYRADISSATGINRTSIGTRAYSSCDNCLVLGGINGVNGASANTNVGIGTSTPAAILHVVGSPRIVDGNQQAGYILTSDADGDATWQAAAAGGFTTADNGLTASSATNVRLGGTLLTNTTLATGAFNLTVSTSTGAVNPLNVTSTTGTGISVASTSGAALLATSTSGVGAQISSDGGSYAASLRGYTAGTNNTSIPVLQIYGLNGAAPSAAGFGAQVDFTLMTTNFATAGIANSLISKWSDATHSTRTSQFIITGINSGVTGDILTLNGNKSIKANGYGAGTFTGTATKFLAVDADGDIIEEDAPSGGITVGTTTITSGTSTRIGFNDAGVYQEDAGLTYNKTSDELTIGSTINSGVTAGNIISGGGLTIGVNSGAGTANFLVGGAGLAASSGGVTIPMAGSFYMSVTTTGTYMGPGGIATERLEVAGNLLLNTAGNKIKIATGANASIGTSAAMTAGSITISTTAVAAGSKIFLTHASVGGTQGILSVGTITAGTSFVINSSSATDTGTVNWWIVN